MASKYARAGGGNWSAAATWSTTSGGSADTTIPTSSDDVFLDASSGAVTIDATSFCLSINCTGYTGTLTHTAAFTLKIGDGTLGASSIALKFVAGMTYTLGNATTSDIQFLSTVTGNTITTGGKTLGNTTFNGVGGAWTLQDSFTSGTGTIMTFTAGDFISNNQTIVAGSFSASGTTTRSITLGSSTVTLSSTLALEIVNTTALSFNAGTSTINITGSFPALHPGGLTFYDVNISNVASAFCGCNALGSVGTDIPSFGIGLTGPINTFHNLTLTGSASKTNAFHFATPHTVTGTLTFTGNSVTNRLLIWAGGYSNILGYPVLLTVTGATVVCSNTDFKDITMTPATNLSGATGGSGNCGGNSGITFTTAATQTYDGTTASWSTAARWTSRVPLPQDPVVFGTFGGSGRTVTVDMPRLGAGITMSSLTNSPTFTVSQDITIFGGLILNTSSTFTLAGFNLNIETRTSSSFTRSTRAIDGNLTITSPGGTITFTDSFDNSTNSRTVTFNQGTLTASSDFKTLSFTSGNQATGTQVRTLNMGTGTWTLTGTSGTPWNIGSNFTPLTLNCGTSTIVFSNTNSNTKTFSGRGFTYYNFTITGVGTGAIIIQGSNRFNTFTIGAPKTVKFTSGTTQLVDSFVANGDSSNLITIQSTTPGSSATLRDLSGTNVLHWCSIQDITAANA